MSWLPYADLPASSLLWDLRQLDTVLVRGPGDTTLQPRALSSFWTFARASAATRINAAGQIESVGNNVARLDHDPVTLQPLGYRHEGQRTNLLLNSLLNGTNLATQNVTVTAAAHTLSFYGTGTVTLSGAHSATVNGTGAYPQRTTLTFTPSAGTLTLTVSGTVQFAQLEVGAWPSSFIPTAGSQVTRVVDNALVSGASFTDWYSATEGTFVFEGSTDRPPATAGTSALGGVSDGTAGNRMTFQFTGANGQALIVTGGAAQFTPVIAFSAGMNRQALAYQLNNVAFAQNGSAATTSSSATIPTVDQFRLGAVQIASAAPLFGIIRRVRYWPNRLTDAQAQLLSGTLPTTVGEASASGSMPLSGSASALAIAVATAAGAMPFGGAAQTVTILEADASGALPLEGNGEAVTILEAVAEGELPLVGSASALALVIGQPGIVFRVKPESRRFTVPRDRA